jgi:iron complex outermembrane receptor protein
MVMRNNSLIKTLLLAVTGLIVFGPGVHSFAQQQEANEPEDFFDMSIEELMNLEITTASKKKEKLFETPAAAYVITSEDIRRSGATSIPDALRMVPGLQVARINANKWAITSRGFNNEFADKMLVMIDGRSIYTPHYGGVRWDTHDVMLEDIERIEVIRGPGGTLWGANAVNGIINIITKNAKDTQGGLLSGGGGTEEQGFGAARYGDKIDENTYFRVYSKYFNRGDGTQAAGGSGEDGWDVFRGGFRIDSRPTDRDEWTLLGDIYDGDVGQTGTRYSLTAPIAQSYTHENRLSGGNMLARWKRTFSADSSFMLQIYFDRERRLEEVFSSTLNTYDIDFQHRFGLNDSHQITWGLGYRLDRHIVDGTFGYSLDPRHDELDIYSGFVQDRIPLVADTLELTVGTKLLHHHYTGLEFQPGGRLLWTPDNRNTVWGSVTRAIKTPARHDRDATTSWGVFQVGPSTVSQEAYGNHHVESEEVMAYELGYRTQATDKLVLDITGFVNDYEEILATERTANISKPGYTIWPNVVGNNLHGQTYGAEMSATYQALENWKLNAGYTFLQMQLHPDNSNITRDAAGEGQSPHNQFHLRSFFGLSDDLELDFSLYYVDNLPEGDIAHYLRFDARLGWHIAKNTELSVVGQNLFDKRHPEFGVDAGQTQTEAERGLYIKLTHRF